MSSNPVSANATAGLLMLPNELGVAVNVTMTNKDMLFTTEYIIYHLLHIYFLLT